MNIIMKKKVIILFVAFILIFIILLLKNRLQIAIEYNKFTTTEGVREVLSIVPSVDELNPYISDQITSVGYAQFNCPFKLDSISCKYEKIVLDSPSVKIIASFPSNYSYDLYKEWTIRGANNTCYENTIIRWDGTLVTDREWKTENEWKKIENNNVLLAYWKEYANTPYKWHKRMLIMAPKSLLSTFYMDVMRFKLYFEMLQHKYYFVKNTNSIILFETPSSIKGYLMQLDTPDSEQLSIALWDTKNQISQMILIVGKNGSLPIEEVKKMLSSLTFNIDELPKKKEDIFRLSILDLGKNPLFTIDIDTCGDYIFSGLDYKLIEKIIACVKDLNEKTKDGLSLLHIAVLRDRINVIKLLLNMGVDINATNDRKETPLHIAAKMGNEIIVEALLEKSAKVDIEDKYGFKSYASASSNTLIETFEKYSSIGNIITNKFTYSEQEARIQANSLLKERGFSPENYKTSLMINYEKRYYVILCYSQIHYQTLNNVREYSSLEAFENYIMEEEFWIRVDGISGEAVLYMNEKTLDK